MGKFTVEPLNWDTDFFGVRSAKITFFESIYKSEWLELLERTNEFDFLTISNKSGLSSIDYLIGANSNAFLVDVNVQLSKNNKGKISFENENFEILIEEQKIPDKRVLEIAENEFVYSRFYNDPFLDKTKAKKVYSEWVKNSFNKANKYFITINENQDCLGFLLFSFKDSMVVIELIAVNSRFKNSRKIGSKLLASLEQYVFSKNVEKIVVGTQISNIKAINFYQRNGYILNEQIPVYHLWNNERKSNV